MRPAATRMSLPSIFCSPDGCAHGKADLLAGAAAHVEGLGRDQESDAFAAEDPLHFAGDIGILAAHQLR